LGTAAAALCPVWPGAAALLIRFTGPQLWWLCAVAHRGAGIPNATVPVPAGVLGVVTVALATLAGVVAWRWRWFRLAMVCAMVCLIAWSMAGWAAGHGATVSARRDTIVG
jgi:competence protein ComEC